MKTLLLALSSLSALFSLFFLLTGIDGVAQISEFELMAAGFSGLIAAVLFVGYVVCRTLERGTDELVTRTVKIQNEIELARTPERRKGKRPFRTEILLKEPEPAPLEQQPEKDWNGPQVAIYVVIGLMIALALAYAASYTDLFAAGLEGFVGVGESKAAPL